MKHNQFNRWAFSMALAFIPAMGWAQNLNPVVEVSKSFVGKLAETRKPLDKMSVPDSLFRFDLDFDYSVFENPYRGAYTFHPYIVDIQPQKLPDTRRQFFLKAGAGYQLRPELHLLWSPRLKGRFTINAYADADSYLGRYRNILSLPGKEGGPVRKLVAASSQDAAEFHFPATHKGYDVASRAGINGYWDWKNGRMDYDLAYRGLHDGDTLTRSSYNAMEMKLKFEAKPQLHPFFYYDVNLDFRLGGDRTMNERSGAYTARFMDLVLAGSLSPRMTDGGSFLMDYQLGLHDLQTGVSSQIGNFSVTPRYLWNHGKWTLSGGVKIATLFKSKDPENYLGKGKSQIAYPDVYVGFKAIPDYLDIYLKVDGGDRLYNYSDLKERNHFFNLSSGLGLTPVIDNSMVRYDASLGIRGNICRHFQYQLSGGFKTVANSLADAVYDTGDLLAVRPLVSSVRYVDDQLAYAHFNFLWDHAHFLVDGYGSLNFSHFYKKRQVGFEPARFMGNLRIRYNWKNRLHAGLYAEGAAGRRGFIGIIRGMKETEASYESRIPGYVNLGLSGEFLLNRKITFWLRMDNLLDMNIQRVPLYPEGGVGFTAGICLNL